MATSLFHCVPHKFTGNMMTIGKMMTIGLEVKGGPVDCDQGPHAGPCQETVR